MTATPKILHPNSNSQSVDPSLSIARMIDWIKKLAALVSQAVRQAFIWLTSYPAKSQTTPNNPHGRIQFKKQMEQSPRSTIPSTQLSPEPKPEPKPEPSPVPLAEDQPSSDMRMLYTISSEQVDVFFENIKNNSLLMDPIRVQLNSDNSEFYYNYGWESREKRKVIVFDPKNNRNLRVIFEGPTNNSSKTTLSMVYTKSNMVLEKNSQDSDAKKIFESFVSQVHVLSEKKLNELQTTESDPKLPQDDSLIRKISTTTWNEGIKKMKQLNCSNISLRAFNETCKCEISVFGRNISFILDWGVYYFKWVDDQESKTTISLDNNKPCVLSTENIPKLACFLDNFIKAVSAYYDL